MSSHLSTRKIKCCSCGKVMEYERRETNRTTQCIHASCCNKKECSRAKRCVSHETRRGIFSGFNLWIAFRAHSDDEIVAATLTCCLCSVKMKDDSKQHFVHSGLQSRTRKFRLVGCKQRESTKNMILKTSVRKPNCSLLNYMRIKLI